MVCSVRPAVFICIDNIAQSFTRFTRLPQKREWGLLLQTHFQNLFYHAAFSPSVFRTSSGRQITIALSPGEPTFISPDTIFLYSL